MQKQIWFLIISLNIQIYGFGPDSIYILTRRFYEILNVWYMEQPCDVVKNRYPQRLLYVNSSFSRRKS